MPKKLITILHKKALRKIYFKKIFLILMFFISINNAEAKVCYSEEIPLLKEISKQVKISYEYNYDKYDNLGNKIYDNFNIIIENLNNDVYIKLQNDTIYYEYKDSNDGGIVINDYKPGYYIFEIRSSKCSAKLSTVSLKIPKYNRYADDERCKNVNSDVVKYCDEWYQESFSEETFSKAIENYNNSIEDKANVKNSLLRYILFIVIFIIFIVAFMIFIINKKRSRLE